ncbi:MAG TPA: hypothetical protein VM366_01860 [Anaerolineae bacterium]|nr:hypothetical protein [Anaerolineae bacterium]
MAVGVEVAVDNRGVFVGVAVAGTSVGVGEAVVAGEGVPIAAGADVAVRPVTHAVSRARASSMPNGEKEWRPRSAAPFGMDLPTTDVPFRPSR